MAFFLIHRNGSDEPDPRLTAFRALLDEVRGDADHAVAVAHHSGWAVCVSGRGVVTLENFEDTEVLPRHLTALDDAAVVALFEAVADGRLDELMARPWIAGRGPARAPAMRITARRGRCPAQRTR